MYIYYMHKHVGISLFVHQCLYGIDRFFDMYIYIYSADNSGVSPRVIARREQS